MPNASKTFDTCVKQGGSVKTRTLSGNRYQRICYLGDKAFADEVKKKKAKKKNKH
jgi:hypothetical protein